MKASINRKKLTITFTNIMNESQLDAATYPAEKSGCIYETLDYSTKVVVRAPSEKHLNEFIKIYNQ